MRSEAPAPGVGSPPSDNSLFGSWHISSAKDAFEDSNAATNNDIVRDILHDGRSFPSHQSKQYWGL